MARSYRYVMFQKLAISKLEGFENYPTDQYGWSKWRRMNGMLERTISIETCPTVSWYDWCPVGYT